MSVGLVAAVRPCDFRLPGKKKGDVRHLTLRAILAVVGSCTPPVDDDANMTASTSTRAALSAADSQWLFTPSDLLLTPSVLGGLDPAEEKHRRCKGVHAIYRMGEYLRLSQHVMNTACIYLHRFFMRKSLQNGNAGYSHYEVAAACVFLACKVEESHRKLPSIIDAAMASFDKSPAGQQRWMERSFRADPASKVST